MDERFTAEQFERNQILVSLSLDAGSGEEAKYWF